MIIQTIISPNRLVFKKWLENIEIGQPFLEPRSDGHGTQITIQAKNNNEVVGTIELERGDPGELSVGQVYVNTNFRNQGVSTKLHTAALEFARSKRKALTSGMLTTKESQQWWFKQHRLGNARRYKVDLMGEEENKLDNESPFDVATIRYILDKPPA